MGKSRRQLTEWQLLVKKIMNENKHKAGFKFGDALKLAKKQYNPKNKTMKKGGMCTSTKSLADNAAAFSGGEGEEESQAESNGGDFVGDTFGKVHGEFQLKKAVGDVVGDIKKLNKDTEFGGGKKSKRGSKKDEASMGGKRKSKKDLKEEKKGGSKIDNTAGGTPYFASK